MGRGRTRSICIPHVDSHFGTRSLQLVYFSLADTEFIDWRNIIIKRNVRDLTKQLAIGRVPSHVFIEVDGVHGLTVRGRLQCNVGVSFLVRHKTLKGKQSQAWLVQLNHKLPTWKVRPFDGAVR